MSDDGTIPRHKMNAVLDDLYTARRQLAEAQETIKAHALEIGDWKGKFETSEGKIRAGKDRFSELETTHTAALGLRDSHDALRQAGITGEAHRNYLLAQVPAGTSPMEHLTALRAQEKVEDSVLASIVAKEETQERAKTPGRLGGDGARHTSKSSADWDKFVATASYAEMVANRDAFVSDLPAYAASYDAAVAATAPPG